MEHPARILVPTVLVSLVLLSLPALVAYVPDDHRGLVEDAGGNPVLIDSGFHFRIAGLQPRPDIYPLRRVRLVDSTGLRTREGFLLRTDFSFDVRVAPADLERFHERKGNREVIAAVRDEAKAALRTAAAREGVEVLFLADPGAALEPRFDAAMRRHGLTTSELEIKPLDENEALRIAERFQRQQLNAAARRLLESAVSRNPRSADLYLALGRIYETAGEVELAEEQYLAALFLDLNRSEAMAWLYGRMLQLGDVDRAERLLIAGRDRVPDSAEYRNWLASIYLLKEDYEAAEAEIRAGLGYHPDDVRLRANLAGIQIAREEYDEAIELLERVVEVEPGMLNAQFNLGMALRAVGRTDEALGWLLPLAGDENPSPVLLNEIARAYLDKGQDELALGYLERSLELHSDQPQIQDLANRLVSTPAE